MQMLFISLGIFLIGFNLTLGCYLAFVPQFPHLWNMDVKVDHWFGLISEIWWVLIPLTSFHLLVIDLFIFPQICFDLLYTWKSSRPKFFCFWYTSCKVYSFTLCKAWDVTEHCPRTIHQKHFSPHWEWLYFPELGINNRVSDLVSFPGFLSAKFCIVHGSLFHRVDCCPFLFLFLVPVCSDFTICFKSFSQCRVLG